MSSKNIALSAAAAGLLAVAGLASMPLMASAALAAETAPFNQAAFDAAQKAGKPVLVHITAPWCTDCAAQKPILSKLLADPKFKGLQIFTVDFDSQKNLVRQFGAQKQSTIIAFKGTKEEGRSTGDTRSDSIARLVNSTV
jgi:thioredoxin 1